MKLVAVFTNHSDPLAHSLSRGDQFANKKLMETVRQTSGRIDAVMGNWVLPASYVRNAAVRHIERKLASGNQSSVNFDDVTYAAVCRHIALLNFRDPKKVIPHFVVPNTAIWQGVEQIELDLQEHLTLFSAGDMEQAAMLTAESLLELAKLQKTFGDMLLTRLTNIGRRRSDTTVFLLCEPFQAYLIGALRSNGFELQDHLMPSDLFTPTQEALHMLLSGAMDYRLLPGIARRLLEFEEAMLRRGDENGPSCYWEDEVALVRKAIPPYSVSRVSGKVPAMLEVD